MKKLEKMFIKRIIVIGSGVERMESWNEVMASAKGK